MNSRGEKSESGGIKNCRNMQTRVGAASLLFLGLLCLIITLTATTATEEIEIPVGVILDLNSSLGTMALNSITIGLHDFYSQNPHYTTRLLLHLRDSQHDFLTAASAASDLIMNEKVHAILGPQNLEQARFVVELGDEARVPVIWFPPSGPSLLPPGSRFFIPTVQSHCFQFKAIAAIIEASNWQSVIPIYEDPEFGNDLIPCLTHALKQLGARVPYQSAIDPHSKDDEIIKELIKLKGMKTHVFLVHMTLDLGSKLMKLAQQAGMMSEGYAWIHTQGLSALIDPNANDIKLKGYMHGALGMRPIVSNRTYTLMSMARKLKDEYNNTLTLYGLWAYDTITALATAAEKAGIVNPTFQKPNNGGNESSIDLAGIGKYDTGPLLRGEILATNFAGLSGVFSLRQGQLEPSQVEVYNVIGHSERIIGYWSPDRGLVQSNSGDGETASKYKLREITWPGNTTEKPQKLRIGVPKTHFTEFVDVNETGQSISTNGFAIDVFNQVIHVLELPYEFVPLPNKSGKLTPWTYDELLTCSQISEKKLDAIIGDITIVANRTECVDFTMPYLDSSVSMVVMVRRDSISRWILFQPFDWSLWLLLGGIFVVATIIVIILERNKNGSSKANEEDKNGSKSKEIMDESGIKSKDMLINPFLIYKCDIDGLGKSPSKWIVILISFLFTIAVQVYTANLATILTARTTAKPSSLKDVQDIKRNNLPVGYQSDSWVRGLLIQQIGFNEPQLKAYESPYEYYKALSDGRKNGGVDAIFDETPYLNLFLSKHCSSCKMAGPIYKTGGFAFAFPKNSSLVSNFSTAILTVTQDINKFQALMNMSLKTPIDNSEYKSAPERRSLKIQDFGGLFPLVLCVLGLFLSLLVLKIIWEKKVTSVVMIGWLVHKTKDLIQLLLREKKLRSISV